VSPGLYPLSSTEGTAPPARAKRGATAHHVYESLAGRITRVELSAGQRLTEEGLAREYAVSRTPVREALSLLQQAGLVERATPRGYVVKLIDLASLDEIYTVRGALEELAVELAAKARGTAAFELFAERVLASPHGTEAYPHGHFHENLVELAGNDELSRLLNDIYVRTHPYRDLDAAIRERAYAVHRDHLEIMRMLREGLTLEARGLMRDHIRRTQATIQALIRAGVKTVSFSPTEQKS
jgi:DNA-binding GntR family transcriptional regulator